MDANDIYHDLYGIRPGYFVLFEPEEGSDGTLVALAEFIARESGLGFPLTVEPAPTSQLAGCVAVEQLYLMPHKMPTYVVARLDEVTDPEAVADFFRTRVSALLETERERRPIVWYRNPALEDSIFGDGPRFNVCFAEEMSCDSMPMPCRRRSRIDEEEDADESLEDDKKAWVDRLTSIVLQYVGRFHEAPPLSMIEEVVRGKLVIRPNRVSPIVVNGDLKLFLPDYNELELKMTPLARTVYILFLCHPEGIRLKDIAEYVGELTEIYSMVKPGASEELARASVADLVDPWSDSLQQKLSLTRRAIRRHILDERLAEQYLIKGNRGDLYRVQLEPELIQLPRALRRG